MTSLKNIQLYIVSTLFISVLTGCGSMGQYSEYNKQQKAADATPSFDPAYFKDSKRRHLAVTFDIEEGVLKQPTKPIEVRPGNLPYRSATAGDVVIVYRDKSGKELGRYAVHDPVLARSCESDEGREGELKTIPNGNVEVLLPLDSRIAQVDVGRPNKKAKQFPIEDKMKSVIEKTEETNKQQR